MSKILIIYTGGTVGMIYDDKTKALRPIGFNEIRNNLPELYRMGIDFYVYAFNPPIDSSDMQPEIWVELASIIEDRYDRYDGFVILHGSDTMAFTASALSFMLENLSKPVILTGSQLPIGKIRTDAKENIITAIVPAAGTMAPIYLWYRKYVSILISPCSEATAPKSITRKSLRHSIR
ncbi:asparaginase [Chitinophaga arvensicola]|uniref:asparaginase n=1 Tax=Chitinophaga arvensicola TaxID=29529 RepID=UPI001C430052|nr:asparaginase [Chitinophaga arvensicola]